MHDTTARSERPQREGVLSLACYISRFSTPCYITPSTAYCVQICSPRTCAYLATCLGSNLKETLCLWCYRDETNAVFWHETVVPCCESASNRALISCRSCSINQRDACRPPNLGALWSRVIFNKYYFVGLIEASTIFHVPLQPVTHFP